MMPIIQDLRSKIDEMAENQDYIRNNQEDIQDMQDEIKLQHDEFRETLEDLLNQIDNIKLNFDDDKELQESMLGQIDDLRGFTDDLKAVLDDITDAQSQNFKNLYENFEALKNEQKNKLDEMKKHHNEFVEKVATNYKNLEMLLKQSMGECNSVVNQRKRDHSDTITELKNMNKKLNELKNETQVYTSSMGYIRSAVDKLVEYTKINNAIQAQDEIDRKAINLLGAKEKSKNSELKPGKSPVSLDKQCLSCSGQVSSVIGLFKMACLSYNSNPVNYRNSNFDRRELIEIQKRMLESLRDESELNRLEVNIPRSITPIPFLPRQASETSDSNYRSYSPELPPLSRKQNSLLL